MAPDTPQHCPDTCPICSADLTMNEPDRTPGSNRQSRAASIQFRLVGESSAYTTMYCCPDCHETWTDEPEQ
jgi:hypothetical protein